MRHQLLTRIFVITRNKLVYQPLLTAVIRVPGRSQQQHVVAYLQFGGPVFHWNLLLHGTSKSQDQRHAWSKIHWFSPPLDVIYRVPQDDSIGAPIGRFVDIGMRGHMYESTTFGRERRSLCAFFAITGSLSKVFSLSIWEAIHLSIPRSCFWCFFMAVRGWSIQSIRCSIRFVLILELSHVSRYCLHVLFKLAHALGLYDSHSCRLCSTTRCRCGFLVVKQSSTTLNVQFWYLAMDAGTKGLHFRLQLETSRSAFTHPVMWPFEHPIVILYEVIWASQIFSRDLDFMQSIHFGAWCLASFRFALAVRLVSFVLWFVCRYSSHFIHAVPCLAASEAPDTSLASFIGGLVGALLEPFALLCALATPAMVHGAGVSTTSHQGMGLCCAASCPCRPYSRQGLLRSIDGNRCVARLQNTNVNRGRTH